MGFRIGDHTISHPYMTRLSYADQLYQISGARRRIQYLTGQPLAALFRPPYGAYNWNTRLAAGQAGMKYLVFTTKHHDGFSMFDTKFTDYRVTSPECPFSANPRSR